MFASRTSPRHRSTRRSAATLAAALVCAVGSATPAAGQEAASAAPESAAAAGRSAAQDSGPVPKPDAQLTGEEIYSRVLDNRFYAYRQEVTMESGDRSENTQTTNLNMQYLSYRGVDPKFLSKCIAKYQSPQDVRHLGYLVIKKSDNTEDQFIYRPSARRVRRINLRGEAVFGTDFSMEDLLPREIEDATYRRIEDSEVDGIPVFVVEVTPLPEKDSEYSRFIVHVEKEHYVTIRTHYWDEYDVLTKELNADPKSITKFVGREREGDPKEIWVPIRSRIEQLKTGTFTELEVEKLTLDVELQDRDFSQRKLTASR